MEAQPPPLPSRQGFFARLAGGALLARLLRSAPEGTQESGGVLPRFLLGFLVLFLAGMALISLVGDQGLIGYFQLKNEAARLESEVAALKVRRQELTLEIRALREDSAYIELLARQKLGFARPGETVIQLPLPGVRP